MISSQKFLIPAITRLYGIYLNEIKGEVACEPDGNDRNPLGTPVYNQPAENGKAVAMRTLWVLFTLASLASLAGGASYIILAWADVDVRAARVIPILVWLIATIAAPVLGAAALVTAKRVWSAVPYLLLGAVSGWMSFWILVGAHLGSLGATELLGLLILNSGAAYLSWLLLLRGWPLAAEKGRQRSGAPG